jgi:hypothetical protein
VYGLQSGNGPDLMVADIKTGGWENSP